MRSLLILLASVLFSIHAFASKDSVQAAHREALTLVKREKLPPPLVAWAFAAANHVGQVALEEASGSWVAYEAAFYRTWDQVPGVKQGLAQEYFERLENDAERESASFGFSVADRHWSTYEERLQRAMASNPAATLISPANGQWVPTPTKYLPPLFPNWGSMLLWSGEDGRGLTRDLAPPAVGSSPFVSELLEVEKLGGAQSTVRTPEQSLIAQFWAAGPGSVTPPGMWIEVAMDLSKSRELTSHQSLALMSKLSKAMSDAGVLCWELKFKTQLWRPITAIRELIPLRSDWMPLLETPPFPSYTSGHSSFSAAGATVLAEQFGSSFAVEVKADTHHGVTRSFPSIWSAALEAGRSRIYGGIHFESDNRDGLELGRRVGCRVAGTCQ